MARTKHKRRTRLKKKDQVAIRKRKAARKIEEREKFGTAIRFVDFVDTVAAIS